MSDHTWNKYRVEASVQYEDGMSVGGAMSAFTSDWFSSRDRAIACAEHLQELGLTAEIEVQKFQTHGAASFDEIPDHDDTDWSDDGRAPESTEADA